MNKKAFQVPPDPARNLAVSIYLNMQQYYYLNFKSFECFKEALCKRNDYFAVRVGKSNLSDLKS